VPLPEILAPAGDADCLRAAIDAGADAVYFGLHGFNARARATNFDTATLGETLRWLHARGRRGYVTLNTLVFDGELTAMEQAVRACADAGVDAIIVQDLGVARLAQAIAPSLPLHASTQMTCTDADSIALAHSLGASRVILARELSLDEIAAIRGQSNVDVEVFVHGALCISYSGQCLTSEAIGGRSANRGACAQACRLPYELVVDGKLRPHDDRAYLLSPEDLEASQLVPRLCELGVASLKIEGRLKGPAYVTAVTRLYRQAVDACAGAAPPTEKTRQAALATFSRGSGPGFFAGVDHQRLVEGRSCDHRGLHAGTSLGIARVNGRVFLRLRLDVPLKRGDGVVVEGGWAGAGELGGRVWQLVHERREVETAMPGEEVLVWLGPERPIVDGQAPRHSLGKEALGRVPIEGQLVGRRVFKNSDPALHKDLVDGVTPARQSIDLVVAGALGEPPRFTARLGSITVSVVGDTPLVHAHATPLDTAVVRDKLGRLGGTAFALRDLVLDWPAGAILPLSSLNRARRALVEALETAAATHHAVTDAHAVQLLAAAAPPSQAPPPPGLFVLCRNLGQAHAAIDAGADGIYLDFLELTGTGEAVRTLRARGPVQLGLAPPRIRKPGEDKIDRYLSSLAPDLVLVRSLGALVAGAGSGVPRIGDFALNVTNRLSAHEVLSRDLSAFTPAFDLDGAQLSALLDGAWAPFAEVVAHHPMPLFHMEHCVIAALLSNGRDHKSCGRPCERHQLSLRDRAGMDHPVEADVGCRNTVFHAAAQSAAELVPRLRAAGVRRFRVELVRESAADTARIVEHYRRLVAGALAPSELWRALRTAGGYGVVRGSLRVLDG
jgi:putative protease